MMSSSKTRVREGSQPPPRRPDELIEKRGYQPQAPLSPLALANPPRGGSHIRPPAAPPKK
jgi:hypothetical protein